MVRTQAWLAAALASLPGVEAVAWHPARSCCEPAYFRESVLRWIDGGVFPGLGLTALAISPDGAMHSEGLALFTTQELRIEPELMVEKAAGEKIGVRLLDWLVENGRRTGLAGSRRRNASRALMARRSASNRAPTGASCGCGAARAPWPNRSEQRRRLPFRS